MTNQKKRQTPGKYRLASGSAKNEPGHKTLDTACPVSREDRSSAGVTGWLYSPKGISVNYYFSPSYLNLFPELEVTTLLFDLSSNRHEGLVLVVEQLDLILPAQVPKSSAAPV